MASITRNQTKVPERSQPARSGTSTHDSRQRRCRRIFALLSDYLDGKLPARQARHVETHLCDCLPCQCFLDDLKHSVSLCQGFRPETLDPQRAKELRELLLKACAETSRKS